MFDQIFSSLNPYSSPPSYTGLASLYPLGVEPLYTWAYDSAQLCENTPACLACPVLLQCDWMLLEVSTTPPPFLQHLPPPGQLRVQRSHRREQGRVQDLQQRGALLLRGQVQGSAVCSTSRLQSLHSVNNAGTNTFSVVYLNNLYIYVFSDSTCEDKKTEVYFVWGVICNTV